MFGSTEYLGAFLRFKGFSYHIRAPPLRFLIFIVAKIQTKKERKFISELKSKDIIEFLKSNTLKKQKIQQLRFELKNPAMIEEQELIESLSVGERMFDKYKQRNPIRYYAGIVYA